MRVIEYKTREDWLQARKKGIGASDVPTILGINEHKSPLALHHEKRGDIEPEDLSDNLVVYMGHRMEIITSAFYEEETGRKLFDPGEFTITYSDDFPWLFTTLDRTIVNGKDSGKPVQLKSVGFNTIKAYQPDEEGNEGQGPLHHQVQQQTELIVTEQDWGSLCALSRDDLRTWAYFCDWLEGKEPQFKPEPMIWDFERNGELIGNIVRICTDFWEGVQSGIEPKIDHLASTADTLALLHPDDTGETKIASKEIAGAINLWRAGKETLKHTEERVAEQKNKIVRFFGKYTFIEGEHIDLSLKRQVRRASITVPFWCEEKLIEAEIPYHVTKGKTHRVLRDAKKEEKST